VLVQDHPRDVAHAQHPGHRAILVHHGEVSVPARAAPSAKSSRRVGSDVGGGELKPSGMDAMG
jgi:hypothetical protein